MTKHALPKISAIEALTQVSNELRVLNQRTHEIQETIAFMTANQTQMHKALAALASATADDPTKHYQINITITPIE